MKKTGIITFHAAHNNGSMLQALALQNIIINKYGLSAEIIDFSNIEQINMYKPLPKPTNIKRFIKNIIWMTNYRKIKKYYISYESFKNNYFILSKEKYHELSELCNVGDLYDNIISGSDQVWNILCRDADDAYYLPYEKIKNKNTYAVSFGANNPFIINKDKYLKYINEFNNVSVREKNAQKWIKENMGYNVPICLDPTMLLNSDEWDLILDNSTPIIKGDYIFYYCFSITSQIQKFLRFISKKYNMPVYFMDVKEWTLKFCWRNKIKLVSEYGPSEYVNYVKFSKIFITTSFHGTAFATIYKKIFWYIDTGNNDLSKDDRAVSFLSQLDLMDRYRKMDYLINNDLLILPTFDNTYIKLEKLKDESYAYLEKIIGGYNCEE